MIFMITIDFIGGLWYNSALTTETVDNPKEQAFTTLATGRCRKKKCSWWRYECSSRKGMDLAPAKEEVTTMNLITLLIGLGAIGVVATFSVLAARSQAKLQRECIKLDGCPSREMEIAMRKVRGR
jgi:hypothetical protein